MDFNYKINKPKYNELNYLITNYFKTTLNDEKKLKKLFDISKIEKRSQKAYNNREIKKGLNSPSFASKKSQSFDDINSQKLSNYKQNECIKMNVFYRKPLHNINNKSFDNIKNINIRYINKNYVDNSYEDRNISNYNIYNYSKTPSDNTINTNNIVINSRNFDKNDSIDNIFIKIPTNITRINQNQYDNLEDSLDNSLFNNLHINSNNFNYPFLQYLNDNNLGTFYNENNLSQKKEINNINNNNYNKENSINDSISNYNGKKKINQKDYKDSLKIKELNKKNLNEKYIRKRCKDLYTYKERKNNLVNYKLNNGKIKKEYYCISGNTYLTYNNINNNQIVNNNQFQNSLIHDNIYFNHKNQFKNLDWQNIINNKNYNNDNIIYNHGSELSKLNNSFKHKKLSNYVVKKKNKKYSTKSYDNTIFKSKIKMRKKKKKPKRRRRNVTFEEIKLDNPLATPIKKEKGYYEYIPQED